MREILFRGLRIDGKGWVEGDLIHYVMGEDQLVYFTSIKSAIIYHVIPETVGQFICNNYYKTIRVFEGDKIKFSEFDHNCHDTQRSGFVVIKNGTPFIQSFEFEKDEDAVLWLLIETIEQDPEFEVIGTIHDHLISK